MSPNSENAMARFLFAILKQKNLTDVDWNQVASDPVLLEPISNGHAARMRYSRFRATASGQAAPKRNRAVEKSRVSKPKKDQQSKKEKLIKSERGASLSSLSSYAQLSPASITSPSCLGDTQDDFSARFLTPCSDDMAQSSVHPSVLNNIKRSSSSLFPTSDFVDHAGHDYLSGAHSPTFSAFDAAYDLSSYASRDISQNASNSNTSQSLGDCTHDWNERFHAHQRF